MSVVFVNLHEEERVVLENKWIAWSCVVQLQKKSPDVGSCVCIVFMQLSKEKWMAWSGVCRFNANQIRKKEKLYVKFLLNYGKKGYCGEQCP